MGPRYLPAGLLFVSAYSPLLLILVIKDLDLHALHFDHPRFSWFLIGSVTISILFLFGLLRFLRPRKNSIEVQTAHNRSNDLIIYTIPYLLCIYGISFVGNTRLINDLLCVFGFLLLLFVLSYKTQVVFLNPVLAIAGYRLFDVTYVQSGKTYEATLLTKSRPEPNLKMKVHSISHRLQLAVPEEDE